LLNFREPHLPTRNSVFVVEDDPSMRTGAAVTEMGCLAYLTKPFSAQSLIEPVEEARAAA
jgi:AmiR/NasT family two-component response regulator